MARTTRILTVYIISAIAVIALTDIFGAFTGINIGAVKYSTVAAAFILSLCLKNPWDINLCLFLTCICDIFLLFTGVYTKPLILFAFVHGLYLAHFSGRNGFIIIYPIAAALVSTLEGAVIIYAASFAAEFIYTSVTKKAPGRFIAAQALFIVCDIFTLLYNTTGDGLFSRMIWLFYAPSQLIIALSFSSTMMRPQKTQP